MSDKQGNLTDKQMEDLQSVRTININKAKVNSLEIITRTIDDKPYYELKYRLVGKKDYRCCSGVSEVDL